MLKLQRGLKCCRFPANHDGRGSICAGCASSVTFHSYEADSFISSYPRCNERLRQGDRRYQTQTSHQRRHQSNGELDRLTVSSRKYERASPTVSGRNRTLPLAGGPRVCIGMCSSCSASTKLAAQVKANQTLCVDDEAGGESSCCTGHGSSHPSQKHHSVSCCPLDATLIQKHDASSLISYHVHLAVLTSLIAHPSTLWTPVEGVPIVWVKGRDVLLQTHILRI